MDLSVSVWRDDDETVITVAGELDMYTAPIVRAALIEMFIEGRFHLILNLRDLEFIDAAGVGVLVGAARRANAGGGDQVVRSLTRFVLRVLEITHVIDALTIED